MYIGIGPEYGKRIREEDAFPYACQRIFSEPQEERGNRNADLLGCRGALKRQRMH